jgi:hypothetical protein
MCVYVFFYYSACSISISNTTCTGGFLHNYLVSAKITYLFYTQFGYLTASYFVLHNLSKGILSVNFFKVFTIFVDEYVSTHGPIF